MSKVSKKTIHTPATQSPKFVAGQYWCGHKLTPQLAARMNLIVAVKRG